MTFKPRHRWSPHRSRLQSGNIFFMLFASIALVGAFGVGASNIMKGMVASMSDVTRKTIAEERMRSAARLVVQNPAETGPAFGECGDNDLPVTLANGTVLNYVEPLQYRDAGSLPKPGGGGLVPENIGAATRDPWGTQYGYCAWNPGSGTSCSDGTTRRLQGGNSPLQTTVAIISAGKDRKFSSTCAAVTGASTTPANCAGLGTAHYNDAVTGHCYFEGANTRDFAGAEAACQAAGGYLASITSSAENAIITSNFTGGDLWFGASDSVNEGVWKITSGESAGQQFWQGSGAGSVVGGRYNNWSGGEPNAAGPEDCAIVSTVYSTWNDIPCAATTGYVCEKSPGPPPSPITKAAGSDDIVMEFSYDQLRGLGGDDLWKVRDTKPNTQTIDKSIEVGGGASFSGAINLMKEGLLLPTDPGDNSVTGACSGPNAGQLRLNGSTSPLSLEICHNNAWVPISMGAGAGGATGPADCTGLGFYAMNDPVSGHCYFSSSATAAMAPNIGTECTANGAYLAVITSAAEHAFLETRAGSISPGDAIYTGGIDVGMTGTYKWRPGGDLAGTSFWSGGAAVGGAYTNWASGEPQNTPGGPDNCMTLYRTGSTFKWSSWNCDYGSKRYLCEKSGTPGYLSATMPAGAVAHWKFSESSGTTVADATGNGNTGTLRNGAVLTTSGKNGGGAIMDASNDWMESANEANFDFNYNQDWTLSGWFELDGTPERELFFKGTRNDGGYRGIRVWTWDTNRNLCLSIVQASGSGGENVCSDFAVPASGWHHYTIVYKGTASPHVDSTKMYIDGGEIGVTPGSWGVGSTILNNGPFGVGSYEDSYGVDGGVDEVVVYNRALTGAEVTQLYNATAADGGSGGSSGPAVASNFNPLKANCTKANSGPFTEAAVLSSSPNSQYFYGTTSLKGKAVIGRSVGGVNTMGVSGGSFTFGGQTNDGYLRTFSDGKYVYSTDNNRIRAYSFNGTSFTALATYTASGAGHVYSDGKYVYLSRGGDGFDILSFSGTAFTLKAHYGPSGNVNGSYSDGKYLYIANPGGGLHAASFDGTTLTILATFHANSTEEAVTGDGTYLYVGAYTDDLYALTFDGTSFTTRGHYVADGNTNYVFTDGVHIFFTNDTAMYGADNLYAATFDGANFTIVGTYDINSTGYFRNIWSDGRYIYYDDYFSKLVALSGFECTKASSRAGIVNPATANLPDGLVGYWKFDDATGTTAMDSSSQSNHGTLYGGGTWGGGVDGGAIVFDGVNDLVQTSGSAVNGPTGSVAVWAKSARNAGGGMLVMGSDGPNRIYVISYDGEIQIRLGTDSIVDTGVMMPATTWTHIALTWNNGNYTVFKNGIQAFTGTYTAAGLTGVNQCPAIGAYNDSCSSASGADSFFAGSLDEAMIFDRQLSAEEINSIYNLTLGQNDNEINPALLVAANKYAGRLTLGDSSTCVIKPDNSGWCAGGDGVGQLGNGAAKTGAQHSITRIDDAAGFIMMSGGQAHACGIKADSSLWCWGESDNGRLGNGTTTPDQPSPSLVTGSYKWMQVSAGATTTCGIINDGRIMCFGAGGAAGKGTASDAPNPTAASDTGPWVNVSTGHATTCAIKTNGSLWCTGNDTAGTLGDNPGATTTGNYNFLPVAEPGPWMSVTVGRGMACAVKLDGSLWCWGDNTYGTIGNGMSGLPNIFTPVRVDNGPWLSVAAASLSYTMCGTKMDGTAWCWGRNNNSQMGIGAVTANVLVPTQILDPGPWLNYIGNSGHTCGMRFDGSVACAGTDGNGRNGNGPTSATTSLVNIVNFPGTQPFTWNETLTALTASGSANISLSGGSAISHDGTKDANNISNGLRFDTGGQTVLRQGGGSTFSSGSYTGGLPSGLVAYWAFEEGSGTTATDSVGTNTGTINGGAAYTTSGKYGKALVFDGVNDYVNVPSSTSIDNLQGITACAWVNYNDTATNNWAGIIDKTTGGGDNGWQLYSNDTDSTGAYWGFQDPEAVYYGGWSYPNSSHSYATWQHLCYTWADGYAGGIWVNGSLYGGSSAGSIANADSGMALHIGAFGTPVQGFFNGIIDEVMIFNRRLSSGEVAQVRNFTGVSGGSTPIGSNLRLSTGLATGSAQLSLRAQDASQTRTLGIDYANANFEFGLNNAGVTTWLNAITPQMEISTTGNVGVGTSGTPAARLDINAGGLRLGNDTGACLSPRAGTMRFISGTNTYEYCNGTSWVTF